MSVHHDVVGVPLDADEKTCVIAYRQAVRLVQSVLDAETSTVEEKEAALGRFQDLNKSIRVLRQGFPPVEPAPLRMLPVGRPPLRAPVGPQAWRFLCPTGSSSRVDQLI